MIIIDFQVILKSIFYHKSACKGDGIKGCSDTCAAQVMPMIFILTHVILFLTIGFIPTSDQIEIFQIGLIVTNTVICIIISLFVMQPDNNDGCPRTIFNSIKSRNKFVVQIDYRDFKLYQGKRIIS